MLSVEHGITRQWYLQLNTTDNDKTTRILTKLQHKYTCLPERPYTAWYSWWWVELSPETCRVKPLRRINAIVASCWIYFTTVFVYCCKVIQRNVLCNLCVKPMLLLHVNVPLNVRPAIYAALCQSLLCPSHQPTQIFIYISSLFVERCVYRCIGKYTPRDIHSLVHTLVR